MKRKIYIILILLLLFLLISGCQEKSIEETLSNSSDIRITVENQSTAPQTEFTITTTALSEYNLSAKDLDIVNAIFKQREMYETKQDEQSYEYTRKPVDIDSIYMFYDGSSVLFAPQYLWREDSTTYRRLNTVYKLSDAGVLTKFSDYSFDMFDFSKNSKGVGFAVYDRMKSEDERLNALCELYSDYREKRQEQYADLEDSENVDTGRLSEEKKILFDNIFNTKNTWERREFKGAKPAIQDCVYIKIWDFGDGTVELYCFYGQKFGTKENYYSGYDFGYSLSSGRISELTDEETKRLKNDLSTQTECEWTVTWSENKKKEVLFDYLSNLY